MTYRVTDVSNRRLPAKAGTPTHQTPGHSTAGGSVSISRDAAVRDVVLAGGLLRSQSGATRVKKNTLPITRLTYTVAELAAATGLSDQQIYNHIERGDLSAKYSGTRRLITVAEAARFIEELPDEDLGPLK